MCTQCPFPFPLHRTPLPSPISCCCCQSGNTSVSQSLWQNTLRCYVTNVVACVFYTFVHYSMILLHTHTHTHDCRRVYACVCVCAYLCLNVSDSFMVICMHLCCVNADENAWGLGLWLWLGDCDCDLEGRQCWEISNGQNEQRCTHQTGGWKRLWTAAKWSSIWFESRKERLCTLWSHNIHNSQVLLFFRLQYLSYINML